MTDETWWACVFGEARPEELVRLHRLGADMAAVSAWVAEAEAEARRQGAELPDDTEKHREDAVVMLLFFAVVGAFIESEPDEEKREALEKIRRRQP